MKLIRQKLGYMLIFVMLFSLFGRGYSNADQISSIAINDKVTEQGTTNWVTKLGGETDHVYFQGTIIKADGAYLIAYSTNDYSNTSASGTVKIDQFLAEIDSKGNILWSKEYMHDNGVYVRSVQESSDGNLIAFGTIDAAHSYTGKTLYILFKMDKAGNMLWNNNYSVENAQYLAAVEQGSDGNYVLVGRLFSGSYTDPRSKIWLGKADSTGNLTWQQTIDNPSQQEPFSLATTSDGGYIMSGSTNCEGAGYFDAYLVRFDKDLNILWSKTYGTASGCDEANSACQTPDGGFVFTGYSDVSVDFESKSNFRRIYIVRVDSAGNVLWEKIMPGEDLGTFNGGNAVIQNEYNTYLVAATQGWSTKFIELDNNGNILWQKRYYSSRKDTQELYSGHFQNTPDGGLIFGAKDNKQEYLVKVDEDCNIKSEYFWSLFK